MQVSPVQVAYDAIALEYDAQVAPSSWVRERLWERLDALFPAGSRVLDVTAGTGLDVLHLLGRGVAVTACDLSPGMLARLAARAPSVPRVVADFNRLEEAGLTGPFDGLISTFAGLNAAADLSGFARAAARLVRPEGVLFLHVLNPRRPRRKTRTLNVRIAGVEVPHRLWTPRELAGVFAVGFGRSRLRGQGILRPVEDAGAFAGRDRWERLLSALPVARGGGTFYTLELIRHG
ncbi:MAG TPA: class I SAM-dependent methyltransferase [Thermoanaerobaculia bacterium]|nr:class I SAM-dependent methyltransferase [Thermoanaerobaculia bacterium]